MKYFFLVLSFLCGSLIAQDHLLITEIVVTPTDGEFVEIVNPTGSTIDLTDYYLTDATWTGGPNYYYNIVTGANAGGGSSFDFHARFPAGTSIGPGEYQTIAVTASGFITQYGIQPTYELFGNEAAVPDMLEALPGSIDRDSGSLLTNGGEIVILYFWDGQSDLVQDVDYVVWGDKAEAVDKSGVAIDGPDSGSETSTYLADTPIAQQIAVPGPPHQFGESIRRMTLVETGETPSGGNGITGNNETSEDLASSFQADTPNPGDGPGAATGNPPQISNIQRSPSEPGPSDIVTIAADVTDNGIVQQVQLFTAIAGAAFDSVDMALSTGSTFEAEIDSQSLGTRVDYFIRAEDDSGEIATTATFFYTVAAADTVVPIAEIQGDAGFIGTEVLVEGIVTVGSGIIASDWTDAYIQDGSGSGINVFRSGTPVDPAFLRGNLVRLQGEVDEFNSVTEIVNYSVEVLAQSQPLPLALTLTTAQAGNTSLEGTLIKVEGAITDISSAGGGTNLTLNDGSGELLIRAWDTAGLDLSSYTLGDTVVISGVMDLFNNDSQILLAYQGDIVDKVLISGADGSGTVSVVPDSVGASQSANLAFTITGNSTETVQNMRIFVPQDWGWTESGSDVQLTGQPFASALTNVAGKQIDISGATLSETESATITINNLTSPAEDKLSQFQFLTAGAAGSLTQIAANPAVAVGAGGGETITPISEIQQNIEFWNGKTVTIEGVVTIGSGILIDTRTTAYVQDESGYGIQAFSFAAPDPDLQRGNLVRMTGTIEEFDLETEITDYTLTILETGVDLPPPLELSTSAVAVRLDREGTFAQVTGPVVDRFSAGGGTNLVVNDGSGEVTLRIWDTANLDLAAFDVDTIIAAKGVIGEFSAAGQLLVAYQEDISVIVIPPSPLALTVPNKPFVPDQGERLPITFSAGRGNTSVILRIYDLGGRLVTTLVDDAGSPLARTIEWDGRDKINELVPLGAYVLHLEVVDGADGKRKQKIAPIVVGTVLK